MSVPGNVSAAYRLTIVPDLMGRYSIIHQAIYDDDETGDDFNAEGAWTGQGYAWTAPSAGLYYCVAGGTDIAFDEFVEGSAINVVVELVASSSDEECISREMSYDGYAPVVVHNTEVVPAMGALWSSLRYFLRADFFGYTVAGEETVTMAEGINVEIGGDPGGDDYMSIEITWFDTEGREKRFNGYIDSDGTSWNMGEARVYDNAGDWVTFAPLTEMKGYRDACFRKKQLVLNNVGGNDIHQIWFENLTLATFLPWSDEAAMNACILQQPTEWEPEEAEMPSSTAEVTWSTPHYFLDADYFGYTIGSQETVTLAGSRNIRIDGDPGGEDFMTIDISWLDLSEFGEVQEGRFFGYFESNGTTWNMFKAEVKNSNADSQDWESFENLTDVVSGNRNSCFTRDSLVITNGNGSEIRFENLTLAVFLPWEDQTVMQARSSSSSLEAMATCRMMLEGRPITAPSSSGNFGGVLVEDHGNDETVGTTSDEAFDESSEVPATESVSTGNAALKNLMLANLVALVTFLGLILV